MKDGFIRFTTMLSGIMRNIRRIMSDIAAEYNVKRSYISVIYYVYRHGPLSAAKLCSLCGEDKANISRTIKALEDEGYITKQIRASARPSVRMVLTEQGEDVGRFLEARVAEAVKVATAGIEPENIAIMYEVLARIDENLAAVADDCN